MPTSDDPRALLGARVTGLLILAFVAVDLLDYLIFAWIEAALDGDIDLGREQAHVALQLIGPTYSAVWVLGLLAWAIGFCLLARARGPARPAAIVSAIVALIGVVATTRYLVLVRASLDLDAFEHIEVWADLAFACNILAPIGAIVTIALLARGRAQARWIFVLAGLACVRPILSALVLAELEWIAPLYDGPTSTGPLLMLVSNAALGAAFVWASAGVDDHTLDHASARSLELARMLVWVRVGLIVVSAIASGAAVRAAQRRQAASMFDTPSAMDDELVTTLAAWLGHIEAAVGVGLAIALAMLGLRHHARDRLLAAAGGLIMMWLGLIGVGLSLAQRDALMLPDSYFSNPLLDHLRLVQRIDPYLRGAGLLALILVVVALMRVADPTGVRDEPRLRGIRLITISACGTFLWIFAREGIASLSSELWTVGIIAILALIAAVVVLRDLTGLLRGAARALRGEEEEVEAQDIA